MIGSAIWKAFYKPTRQPNKVKRTNKGGRKNTRGDISVKTRLYSLPSMSSNPGKTVTCTEAPRDENILTMQSGEGQYYKRQIDEVVHPNVHLEHHDMSGPSAPILTAREGSLSHLMDDESKQMHADSSDVKVSNNQNFKDSLPVIEHAGSSGEGLPYAPENWPSPGDVWTWHVGKRRTLAGFWQDRSVHPPDSLLSSTGNKMTFNSRVSLEQYIRNTFPDADVDAFFASFIWKIPCTNAAKEIANAYTSPKIIKINGCSKAAPAVRPGDCKASNEMCSIKAKTSSSLTPATCYICCTEPNFCQYCCCILCSKTIDWICESYNFIKCEAPVEEKFICGHVAHIECALHAYMGGKVGGSVDLDAQYYCRCCDNKTDLLLHVEKIIKVCESIDNRDDKGKVLNLGLCILGGSEKEKAKKLRNAMLMEKLKLGASLDEMCKKKSEISEPVQGMGFVDDLERMMDRATDPNLPTRKKDTSKGTKRPPADGDINIVDNQTQKRARPTPSEEDLILQQVMERSLHEVRYTPTPLAGDGSSSSAEHHVGTTPITNPMSPIPEEGATELALSPLHFGPSTNLDFRMIAEVCKQMAAKLKANTTDLSSDLPSGITGLSFSERVQFARDDALLHAAKLVFLSQEVDQYRQQFDAELESKLQQQQHNHGLALREVQSKLDSAMNEVRRSETSFNEATDTLAKKEEDWATKEQEFIRREKELERRMTETQAVHDKKVGELKSQMAKMVSEDEIAGIKKKNTMAAFLGVYRHNHKRCPDLSFDFLGDERERVMEDVYRLAARLSAAEDSHATTAADDNDDDGSHIPHDSRGDQTNEDAGTRGAAEGDHNTGDATDGTAKEPGTEQTPPAPLQKTGKDIPVMIFRDVTEGK